VPRQFGWLSASLAISKGKTSPSSIDMRRGKRDRAPELADELVRLKVDLILVSGGGNWVQAAKNATKTIPIVMTGVGPDPVKAGLIESLARPGGNVTGLTILNPELGGKRLELLKEIVAGLNLLPSLSA
jgi:putative tryptophan/tyrosine transport system substrate-binding protein